jgi:MoaA/NifB/PqqE/SkfB family radical SAM enzyme
MLRLVWSRLVSQVLRRQAKGHRCRRAFARQPFIILVFEDPYTYHRLLTSVKPVEITLSMPLYARLGAGWELVPESKIAVLVRYLKFGFSTVRPRQSANRLKKLGLEPGLCCNKRAFPCMLSHSKRFRRTVRSLGRRAREIRMIAKGLLSTGHPILAHVIPMRRCNLSCTYCNEYDDFSKPVALDVMYQRLDQLAHLGTTIITISGGEPLLHPELDKIIARIRRHGMLAGMITNGYLLTAERIQRLNRAGLDHLQISIDNVKPDDVSKKSLKVLDKKLQLLAEHAEFHVNINSVVGGGIHHPQDALVVGKRALELGFTSTVGIIHDGDGQLQPLGDAEREVYSAMRAMEKSSYARVNGFQDNIAHGRENAWRCRSGARYLYICEDGLVHYCSQQRGYPAKPLLEYTEADIRREYRTAKSCAPRCTVACVHQVAYIDGWRGKQDLAPALVEQPSGLVQIQ